MARPSMKKMKQRIKASWEKKINWDEAYREAYSFALPQRNLYDNPKPGQPKGSEVFDSTAIKSTNKFANRIVSALFPAFQNWAKLEAGPLVEESKRDEVNEILEKATNIMFAVIHHASSFQTAIGECALDLAAGTMNMLINKGSTIDEPILYQATPQIQVALEEGPNNKISGFFRKHKVAVRNITQTWPDAKLTDELIKILQDKPETEVELDEATYYDPDTGWWFYDVIYAKSDARMVKRKSKSSPWAAARWIKAANEVHGRGPLLQAMPDIKTLNKVIELVLKNASLAISGPYTVVDDGVINPSMVRVTPGAMIAVARNAGHPSGPSIAPLERSGSFDIAAMETERLQDSIKGLLLDDSMPPMTGAVRSPTEIIERAKDLSEDIGAAFGRLINEFIVPMIQRTLDLLVEWKLVDLPDGIQISGIGVKLTVTSPLAMLQNLEDVQNFVRWIEIMNGTVGPEIAMLSANMEDAGAWLGEKLGVPQKLIRKEGDRKAMQQMVAKIIAARQQAEVPEAGAA